MSEGAGGGGGVAAALIGAKLLAFATSPIVARELGPADRGRLALAGVYSDASSAVFGSSLPASFGFYAKERRWTEEALLATAWRLGALMLPPAFLAAGALSVGPLAGFDAASLVLAAVLVAIAPVANTVGNVYRTLLIARRDLAGIRDVTLLGGAIRFTGLVGAWLLGSLTLPVAIVFVCYADWMANAYVVRRLRTQAAWSRPAPMREIVRYGLRAAPGTLADFANTRLDQILIAPMLGTRALGVYAVAVAVNSVPLQIARGLAAASFAHVVARDESGRRTGRAYIARAWLSACFVALPLGLVILVGLVPLYGAQYEDALAPALILLPGTVAYCVFVVQNQVALALGHPTLGSAAQLWCLVVTAALLPVGILAGGVPGAAVAAAVAYGLRTALLGASLRRRGVASMTPTRTDVQDFGDSLRRLLRRGR